MIGEEFSLPIELYRLLDENEMHLRQTPPYFDKKHPQLGYQSSLRNGELFLTFIERSTFLQRLFCGPYRAFEMDVTDIKGKTIMIIKRPLKCPANFCFCCPYEMSVETSVGELVGQIIQKAGCSTNSFVLFDRNGDPQLLLKGPWFSYHCCLDLIYKIYAMKHKQSIGRIIRRWDDQYDHFRVVFPLDLDLRMKVLLLCSAIFLDFVYFGNS